MTWSFKTVKYGWLIAAFGAVSLAVRQVGHIWSEARSVGFVRAEYFGAEHYYSLSPPEARALEDIGLNPDWHAAFVSLRFVLVAGITVAIAALLWRRARTWAPLFLAWFLLGSMAITAIGDIEGAGPVPE